MFHELLNHQHLIELPFTSNRISRPFFTRFTSLAINFGNFPRSFSALYLYVHSTNYHKHTYSYTFVSHTHTIQIIYKYIVWSLLAIMLLVHELGCCWTNESPNSTGDRTECDAALRHCGLTSQNRTRELSLASACSGYTIDIDPRNSLYNARRT